MAYVSKIKVGSDTLLVGSNLYGECSTAADVAAKVVNISGFSQLSSGVTIHVKFDNTNKALSPTLNVSSTGAKPIYRQGKITPSISVSSSWADGAIVSLTYNTSNISTGCWVMNDVNIDPSEDVSYITNLTPYLLRPTCDGLIRGSGYNKETDEIVGGTVAWNQLCENGNFSNGTNSWYTSSATISVANNEATITSDGTDAAVALYQNKPLTVGHRYLVSFEAKSENIGKIRLRRPFQSSDMNLPSSYQKYQFVNTAIDSTLRIQGIKTNAADAGSYMVRNVQVSDLTVDFGSAIADYAYTLESATAGAGIAWLKAHGFFTKPYYANNAGTLLSVNTSAHKMTGFNQFDLSAWLDSLGVSDISQIDAQTYLNSKVVWDNRTLNYKGKVCLYQKDITVYSGTPSVNFRFEYTDGTAKNAAFGTDGYVVSDTDKVVSYIRTQYAAGGKYNFTNAKVCISLSWDGERDGEYEPYEEHTYALDESLTLRGIPKLDANNNLYYDGDTYASDGTVTRKYGVYTFTGNETWVKGTYNSLVLYYTVVSNPLWEGYSASGAISNVYPKSYVGYSITPDKAFNIGASLQRNVIFFRDDSISTTQEAQAIWSVGKQIVFKLATPTTETADTYTNPQIVDDFGTEEYIDEREVPIPVGHNTTYDSISMIGPNVINKTLILQYS